MTERFSPVPMLKDSLSTVTGLPSMFKKIPLQLDQILHDAESGNLQVRAINPQLEYLPQIFHHFASRMALFAFVMSMTLAAVLMMAVRTSERSLDL